MNLQQQSRVVLLACGSFNPITNMHLRMFEIAKDHLHKVGRHKVIGGIISPVNDAYVKKDLESAKHRCAMIQLALKSCEWIKLDPWETEQPTWLETRKVLDHHQNVLNMAVNENNSPRKRLKVDGNLSHGDEVDNANNNDGPVELKLLCGADLLESFGTPGLWKEDDIADIVNTYGLVVVTRQGSDPYKFIYDSDVLSKHQNNIIIVTEWVTNEISATKVRRALRRGDSVKYLLQDPVIDYIVANKLYSVGANKCVHATTNGYDMPQ